MFIKAHDLNDGAKLLLNTDDISRVEECKAGCKVYFRSVADDFDRTRHQVMVPVEEDFSYFEFELYHGIGF